MGLRQFCPVARVGSVVARRVAAEKYMCYLREEEIANRSCSREVVVSFARRGDEIEDLSSCREVVVPFARGD